jgi:hypothetical protein
MRLDANRGMYGLCQAVQYIRPQRALAFEEFTENLRRNACVASDFANESAATINGSTQMAAERLLGLRLHHSVVPLAQATWAKRNVVFSRLFSLPGQLGVATGSVFGARLSSWNVQRPANISSSAV